MLTHSLSKRTASKTTKKKLPAPDAYAVSPIYLPHHISDSYYRDEDVGAILVEDSADEEVEAPASCVKLFFSHSGFRYSLHALSPRKIASPGKKVVKMVPEVVISTPPPSKRVARAPASTS